jgi:hypothetical protein
VIYIFRYFCGSGANDQSNSEMDTIAFDARWLYKKVIFLEVFVVQGGRGGGLVC